MLSEIGWYVVCGAPVSIEVSLGGSTKAEEIALGMEAAEQKGFMKIIKDHLASLDRKDERQVSLRGKPAMPHVITVEERAMHLVLAGFGTLSVTSARNLGT